MGKKLRKTENAKKVANLTIWNPPEEAQMSGQKKKTKKRGKTTR